MVLVPELDTMSMHGGLCLHYKPSSVVWCVYRSQADELDTAQTQLHHYPVSFMMFSWPFVIRPAAAGHCSVWGGDVSIVTPILVIYSTRPNLEWDGIGQDTL